MEELKYCPEPPGWVSEPPGWVCELRVGLAFVRNARSPTTEDLEHPQCIRQTGPANYFITSD
jgi:hypothetical protein